MADMYAELAKGVAKAQDAAPSDGDYLNADQQGVILVHSFSLHKGTKGQSGILTGEIVESSPKVQGALVQKPGTKVKRIYSISKFPEVALQHLKRDTLAICGIDPSDLKPSEFEELLAGIFRENTMRGVLAGFNTATGRPRPGKATITDVRFNHIDGEAKGSPNSDAEVEKRIKAMR